MESSTVETMQMFENLLLRGLELELYIRLSEKPQNVILKVVYQYCEPRLHLRWKDTSAKVPSHAHLPVSKIRSLMSFRLDHYSNACNSALKFRMEDGSPYTVLFPTTSSRDQFVRLFEKWMFAMNHKVRIYDVV